MAYKAGTWIGKVVDYGVTETKDGAPAVFVSFDVDMKDDGVNNMTWRGSLKEGKGREITLKALLALGFRGRDVSELIDGPDSNMIDVGREAKLVCENEEYEGKTYCKIKWVNSMTGGPSGVQRADPAQAKAKLLKLGLAGDLAKLRTTMPVDNSDVPF